MTRVTTVINQKGGVGKTTTAHAMATGLLKRGGKPLVVDADPQGNISYTMRADVGLAGLYEVMKEKETAAQVIQHTQQGDVLPSSLLLSAADIEFTQTGREYLLRDGLAQVKGAYTHVIIDSPPTLGILTINAMTASDDVVIPMGADIYSLQGLAQLYQTIRQVRRFCNPQLAVAGLLITRSNRRSVLTRELTQAIEQTAGQLDTKLYDAVIREGIAIKEAQTQRASLFDTHPTSGPTLDYAAFLDEYLAQEEK